MDKIYTYDDAEVTIVLPESLDNLKRATEIFIRAVIKGGYEIGNINKSRAVGKQ